MRAKFRELNRTWIICFAALCMLCIPTALLAQCREPTAPERQAAENAARVIQQTLDAPVASLGWKAQGEKSVLSAGGLSIAKASNPPRPLMSCGALYSAKFIITETNSRYATVHAQTEKLTSGHAKPDEIKEISRAMAAGDLEIRATENEPYMRSTRSEPIRKLDVPGVAVAFQEPSSDDELKVDTTVCFGAWKPEIVFGANNRYIPFPFLHPKETPFIENLCVRIHATPEVAEDVLHKVNWQSLNAALAK